MDKQTLGSWGSLVAVVIIIAMMISFATPFANLVKTGTLNMLEGFGNVANNALDNVQNGGNSGGSGTGGSGGGTVYPLARPMNLDITNSVLTFDPVTDADTYILYVNGEEVATSNTNSFDVSAYLETLPLPIVFEVKATDSTGAFGDSSLAAYTELAPGLYETGSNYSELITSWNDLLANGVIMVSDGQPILPDNLPEKNEYGFYYGAQYDTTMDGATMSLVFGEDGSLELYEDGVLAGAMPTGVAVYSNGAINMSAIEWGVGVVSSDGFSITFANLGLSFVLGTPSPAKGTIILGEDVHLEGELLLPDDGSVIYIPEEAFVNQTSLTGIVIPTSVVSIEKSAFKGCENLTNITIPFIGADVDSANEAFFGYIFGANKFSTQNDYIPSTLTDVVITSGTIVPAYAFYTCENIENIVIAAGVERIDECAFSACTSLENVIFEGDSQLSFIGSYSFSDCKSLVAINIPYHVTTIGANAFYGCKSLVAISIPYHVTTIGESAFQNCALLASVNFAEGSQLTQIDYAAFGNCKSLTNITIPANVTTINSNAFNGCTGLANVTFEENSKLATLGGGVFTDCSSLDNVVIPAGVTQIDAATFSRCTNLTSIEIPTNVTVIEKYAFYECNSLISVTIGNSVTSIGEQAFYECTSLDAINYAGTMEQWNSITKGLDWNLNVPATYVQCTDGQVALN